MKNELSKKKSHNFIKNLESLHPYCEKWEKHVHKRTLKVLPTKQLVRLVWMCLSHDSIRHPLWQGAAQFELKATDWWEGRKAVRFLKFCRTGHESIGLKTCSVLQRVIEMIMSQAAALASRLDVLPSRVPPGAWSWLSAHRPASST